MSEMKLPKFKSVKEEVEFWDSFDTAQILEIEMIMNNFYYFEFGKQAPLVARKNE